MRVLTTDGLRFLPDLSDREASVVGRHWNAVRRYLETGAVADVWRMEGTVVAGMRLETNLAEIEYHAIRGDMQFESMYGEVQ
jgi:hypothetical protein